MLMMNYSVILSYIVATCSRSMVPETSARLEVYLLRENTMVVGTVGYVAPEYIQTGRLSAKSDAWSFDVVLCELISVRKLIALANKYLMKNPKSRPRMSEVVALLSEIIETMNDHCTRSRQYCSSSGGRD